jgi:hypothetical protein
VGLLFLRVEPVASTAGITTLGAGKRRGSDFEFQEGANHIVGIVMLEIQGADDLPRLANSTYLFLFIVIIINSTFFSFSDPHGMGRGPLRRHLFRQQGFPYPRHPAPSGMKSSSSTSKNTKPLTRSSLPSSTGTNFQATTTLETLRYMSKN